MKLWGHSVIIKGIFLHIITKESTTMKYLMNLYIVMAIMVFVNLTSEFIFKGEYSAIASWATLMLFLLGTIFFANARYFLSKKS